MNFRRLQAETTRCNSSDEDSTDSGEEIDSPLKIAQSTEGMDTSESKHYGPICSQLVVVS